MTEHKKTEKRPYHRKLRPCAHAPACPYPALAGSEYCEPHGTWIEAQRRWAAEHPSPLAS